MKKAIQVILVLALVLNLVACGSSTTNDTKGENPASTEGADTEANTVTDETDAATDEEPVTFTIFIDHTWFWHDSWGSEPVSQEITTQTGVTFEVIRATDEQQLSLLIAAGDLPDFVYTDKAQTMALLEDSDICYSYNELVEKTGVDIYATDDEIRNNTTEDGNYYALRNVNITQEAVDAGEVLVGGGVDSIAFRTDIYEEIGAPEINTLDDLENALVAAKELYPNIIPLLNDERLWYFAQQLGLKGSDKVGYNSDGQPCYFLNIEGIEEYFALLNRFARKGLIDAEAQTYNYDRFTEVRNRGGSFMQLRTADEAVSSNNAATEAGTGYTWKLLANDLSDNALVSVSTSIGWSGTYISKNCANPERAIEFMSWCRSEEGRKLCSWGIQGEHWDYNENGQTVTTEQYREEVSSGKQKQDDFGIGVWIFGDQGDENAFIDYAVTDPDQIDYTTRLQNGAQHTAVMSELYFAIPSSGDELIIFNSLNDMYKSEVLKVIFAETDGEYESALDNMYRQAEQLGIDKLETWMGESVAEHK